MYAYDQARVLAKAIRDSVEYKDLKRLKDKIEKDPQAEKMFAEYRSKQLEIQKLHLTGQKVPDDKMQGLQQLHQLVIANSTLREFLEAENRFGTMLGDVQKILVEDLEL